MISILADREGIYYHCIHVQSSQPQDLVNAYLICHVDGGAHRFRRVPEPVPEDWLKLTIDHCNHLSDVVRLREDDHEGKVDQEEKSEQREQVHPELVAHGQAVPLEPLSDSPLQSPEAVHILLETYVFRHITLYDFNC